MKFTEVRVKIDAPASDVWAVLTNRKLLQNSDLGILKLDGEIALGNKLSLVSEVSPARSFSLKVSVFEPCRHMVWRGGMPLGLFTGERSFVLTKKNQGCELHIREEFNGLLSNMIFKSMPDLAPSFNKLANGIKNLAEEATK